MKAIVCSQYGSPDVLKVKEVARPTPQEGEILIRVQAAPVNFGDLMARNFKAVTPQQFNMPFILWLLAKFALGFSQPRVTVLGSEFAGKVEATGKNVRRFKPGDAVFGYLGQSFGAYAEYLVMSENGTVAHKPDSMSFEEAAAAPYGAIMALNLLRKANIQPGQKVLINGASGGIGSAAVQIARHLGAQVTGVCATPRMELVRALGAERVIDYTQEDFTQSGEKFDLIFDVLGKGSFSRAKSSLKPNGLYLYASFKMKQLLQMLWTSITGGQKVICAIAPGGLEDLLAVKELIEMGKIRTLIDRRFPMEQAAEAHRYVEAGGKKGSVVIVMQSTE